MRYDLLIIGSGGAAFAAAISAVRKGKRVVMLEQGDLVGGTCVNAGCIPSKALLAAAGARHEALRNGFPGVSTAAEPVDPKQLFAGKEAIVSGLRHDKYLSLAHEYGWDLHTGTGPARFAPGSATNPVVEAGDQRFEAGHYLVATGSTPDAPAIDGLATSGYLTSTDAMGLDRLPRSLLVLGGGYIGLEQAQLFSWLGVEVTVLEAMDRLAPNEEPEIGAVLSDVFSDEGIGVHTGTKVTNVRRESDSVIVDAGRTFTAEALLVATGRRPATAGLALENAGVEVGAYGEVVVDAQLRTANPRVWAAGDVTGHPQFIYVAGAHGAVVADNIFDGARRTIDYAHLPRVTFTSPQVAAVGLTEAEAAARRIACETRVLPLEYVPRALVDRDTRGLFKLVAERETGKLLGVHAVAGGAGDAILAGVYALENEMTVEQLAKLWCPYLTMAEGIKLAAQTFLTDVPRLSCCAA